MTKEGAKYVYLLHPFALWVNFCTLLLLGAGALVTGTGSGLAVPDWPLSFGQFFPEMVGGVLYEHGHRMVAGTVAVFTALFALYAHFKAPLIIKRLSKFALAVVLVQALLGGLTVLFKLPTSVSVSHAILAQVFFCIVTAESVLTSTSWENAGDYSHNQCGKRILKVSRILPALFLLQLALGATMRHLGAGLAIPDFPLMFGGFWPPFINLSVGVHLAHRLTAYLIVFAVVLTAVYIYRRLPEHLGLQAVAGALLTFVTIQIFLGALAIWLRKPVLFTTLHLMVGAVSFSLSIVFWLTCHRLFETNREEGEGSFDSIPLGAQPA